MDRFGLNKNGDQIMTTKEAVKFVTRNRNITGNGRCGDNRRRPAVRTNHENVTKSLNEALDNQ